MQYVLDFFFEALAAITNAFDSEIILFTSAFVILIIFQFIVRFVRNVV